jgi:hypothetical protein
MAIDARFIPISPARITPNQQIFMSISKIKGNRQGPWNGAARFTLICPARISPNRDQIVISSSPVLYLIELDHSVLLVWISSLSIYQISINQHGDPFEWRVTPKSIFSVLCKYYALINRHQSKDRFQAFTKLKEEVADVNISSGSKAYTAAAGKGQRIRNTSGTL